MKNFFAQAKKEGKAFFAAPYFRREKNSYTEGAWIVMENTRKNKRNTLGTKKKRPEHKGLVKERYAFLYRPEKVSLIEEGEVFPDPLDRFIREPYYATFKAGDFQFTLATIHVLFGDSKKDRREEIKLLPAVYRFLSKDHENTIILGDFNMPPEDPSWDALGSDFGLKNVIASPEKTTITDTSLYDNIWTDSPVVRSGVMRFDETMFGDNDEKAENEVSDHRPIWADFKID